MLKLAEELNIILLQSIKDKKQFIVKNYLTEHIYFDYQYISIDKKLTPDTDIEQLFIDMFKECKDKPNKESEQSIKLLLHEYKEKLINNREYNKEFVHIIKFGDLIIQLKELLDENMYIPKKNSIYSMLHNDDLIQFQIAINKEYGTRIRFNIEINKTDICKLLFIKGKDIDISYLAPNFTFDSLISLVNNSIDILNIRNQKIEVKRNEFRNEIKNFYNEEKMDNLINRIKENV